MTYAERQALNGLLANKQYSDTRSQSTMAEMAASSNVGTAYRVDGATGRILSAIADGTERMNPITNSNLLGITTPAYSRGNSGNAGFGDGR